MTTFCEGEWSGDGKTGKWGGASTNSTILSGGNHDSITAGKRPQGDLKTHIYQPLTSSPVVDLRRFRKGLPARLSWAAICEVQTREPKKFGIILIVKDISRWLILRSTLKRKSIIKSRVETSIEVMSSLGLPKSQNWIKLFSSSWCLTDWVFKVLCKIDRNSAVEEGFRTTKYFS